VTRAHSSLLALCVILVQSARVFAQYYSATEIAHLDGFVDRLRNIDEGRLWFLGPDLGNTGICLGGPLYYLLTYPASLLGPPVIGFVVYYYLLELAAIFGWIWLCRRAGLRAELVWAGALMLAWFPESKTTLAENMTMCSLLAIWLFGAVLAAGKARRWGWSALPGLLFGLICQVHGAAVILTPAAMVALLWQPGGRWRRLAIFWVGFVATLPLSINGYTKPIYGGTTSESADLWQSMDMDLLLLGTGYLGLNYAVALLGLVVLLARHLRRNGDMSWAWQTLLWAALPYGALTLLIGLEKGLWSLETRYAMINPARAVLAGLFLALVVDGLGRASLRFLGRKLRPAHALVGLGLLMAGAGAAQGITRYQAHQQAMAQAQNKPCDCQLLGVYFSVARLLQSYSAAIGHKGLPGYPAGLPPREPSLDLLDPMYSSAGDIIYWRRTRGLWRDGPVAPLEPQEDPEGASEGEDDEGQLTLLVAPRLDLPGDVELAGALDYGPLSIIPVQESLEIQQQKPAGQGRYKVELCAADLEQGGQLMLTVGGMGGYYVPHKPYLKLGKERVNPVGGCECRDPRGDSSAYAAWLLFDLSGRKLPGCKVEVVVRHEGHEADSPLSLLLLEASSDSDYAGPDEDDGEDADDSGEDEGDASPGEQEEP